MTAVNRPRGSGIFPPAARDPRRSSEWRWSARGTDRNSRSGLDPEARGRRTGLPETGDDRTIHCCRLLAAIWLTPSSSGAMSPGLPGAQKQVTTQTSDCPAGQARAAVEAKDRARMVWRRSVRGDTADKRPPGGADCARHYGQRRRGLVAQTPAGRRRPSAKAPGGCISGGHRRAERGKTADTRPE